MPAQLPFYLPLIHPFGLATPKPSPSLPLNRPLPPPILSLQAVAAPESAGKSAAPATKHSPLSDVVVVAAVSMG